MSESTAIAHWRSRSLSESPFSSFNILFVLSSWCKVLILFHEFPGACPSWPVGMGPTASIDQAEADWLLEDTNPILQATFPRNRVLSACSCCTLQPGFVSTGQWRSCRQVWPRHTFEDRWSSMSCVCPLATYRDSSHQAESIHPVPCYLGLGNYNSVSNSYLLMWLSSLDFSASLFPDCQADCRFWSRWHCRICCIHLGCSVPG